MMIYHKFRLLASLLLLSALVSAEHEETPQEFTKSLNDLRKEYAKRFKVPNMHELIWSDELANLPNNWTDNWSAFAYRAIFLVPISGIRKTIEKDMEQHIEKPQFWLDETGRKREDYGRLELLLPFQTFIACSPKYQTDDLSITPRRKITVKACMIGPHVGEQRLFDISGNSNEVPGSKCKAKFENVDGLCVAKEPGKRFYIKGDPQEFVDDINSARRKYAKRYSVQNMHKLEWSKSLVDTLLDYYEHPQHDHDMRNVHINYAGVTEEITWMMDKFSKFSAHERSKYLEEHLYTNLELVNPRQTHIGCAWHTQERRYFNMCSMGSIKKLELWDFDAKPKSAPGSKCAKGYVNDDGLCSKSPEGSDSETSISSSLLSFYSILLCTLVVQILFFD